jgi:hypothetical protein
MRLAATVAVVVFLLVAAVAAASNGTPQERAMNQACFARAGIGSATANLAAQVISPGTPANVRSWLMLIRTNLRTIRTTLPTLPTPSRRAMLLASVGFARQLARITPALLAAPAGPAPPRQLVRFHVASQLAMPIYQKTLGAVPC